MKDERDVGKEPLNAVASGSLIGRTVTINRPRAELIAWASTNDADVPNSGRIEFRDAGDHRR